MATNNSGAEAVISALNRINQSLRATSITLRIFEFVAGGLIHPFTNLAKSLVSVGDSVLMFLRNLYMTGAGLGGWVRSYLQSPILTAFGAIGAGIGNWASGVMSAIQRSLGGSNSLISRILGDVFGRIKTGLVQVGVSSTGRPILQQVTEIIPGAVPKAFVALGRSISTVLTPTLTLGVVFGAMLAPVAALAGMFDPAALQQFQLAVGDLLATVGQVLLPILEAATPIVRQLSDVIGTMAPAFQPVIAAIIEIMSIFSELFVPVARILVPLMGILAFALKALTPIIQLVVNVLTFMAKVIEFIFNRIIEVINWVIRNTPGISDRHQIQKMNFGDLQKVDTTGNRVRETTRVSGEDMASKIRESAFGASQNWARLLKFQEDSVSRLDGIMKALETGGPNKAQSDDPLVRAAKEIGMAQENFGSLLGSVGSALRANGIGGI